MRRSSFVLPLMFAVFFAFSALAEEPLADCTGGDCVEKSRIMIQPQPPQEPPQQIVEPMPPVIPPEPEPPACKYDELIGQNATEVDHSVFPEGTVVRILHPDEQVTMEYMMNRVNLIVDEDDIIVSVTCG